MTDEETWQPAVDAIDAIFEDEYDRAEKRLLAALGQVRKEREQKRRAQ